MLLGSAKDGPAIGSSLEIALEDNIWRLAIDMVSSWLRQNLAGGSRAMELEKKPCVER